ncbi:MAG: phytoene synthase [Planctomycetaceae bacterium]|nr:MAG: phytoene synthase [Planctomycetaceae bacterium]
MWVLYAYMRWCDDLADDPQQPVSVRVARLQAWKHSVQQALDTGVAEHPILLALVSVARRYALKTHWLTAVIDGGCQELHQPVFSTLLEWEEYCFQVAGAVGMCCLAIWDYQGQQREELARICGQAFQRTNMLRDLFEDLKQGKCFLPDPEWQQHRLSPQELLEPGFSSSDPRYQTFMADQCNKARHDFMRAKALEEGLPPASRAVFRCMWQIYYELLQRIEASGYSLQHKRVKLSAWRKGCIVWHAWRHRHVLTLMPNSADLSYL